MAKSRTQCMEYVRCTVEVEIAFPKDQVICDLCEFCRTENYGSRCRCLLNSKILPYHSTGIGIDCPLPIREQLDKPEQLPGQQSIDDY